MAAPTPLGENITVEETDTEIILKFKKDHRGKFTGKTTRVASTLGNQKVGEIYIGLNAYVKGEA